MKLHAIVLVYQVNTLQEKLLWQYTQQSSYSREFRLCEKKRQFSRAFTESEWEIAIFLTQGDNADYYFSLSSLLRTSNRRGPKKKKILKASET